VNQTQEPYLGAQQGVCSGPWGPSGADLYRGHCL